MVDWRLPVLVGLLWSMTAGCQAVFPDLEVSETPADSESATGTGTATDDTASHSEAASTEPASTESAMDSGSSTVPTDTYSDMDTLEGTDTLTGDTGTASDSGTVGADTETESGTTSDSTDSGADTADTATATDDTATVSDTGASDSDTGSGLDTDTPTEAGTDIAWDTDTEPVADCAGEADFTPCGVVTSPEDRTYDVCMADGCVSPGCGAPECNTSGPHFTLSDSGLRSCFSNSGVEDCALLDAMYNGQDAHFGWDAVNDASLRFESTTDVAAPDELLVTDMVTGLMWQGCPAGLTGTLCNSSAAGTQMTWVEAVDYCDKLPWGGYSDWHLPDVYEFLSIVNFSENMPAFSTDVFYGVPDNDTFWTATSHAVTPDVRWEMNTSTGAINSPSNNATSFVRCVRGGQTARPSIRFVRASVGGQPLVTDYVTGRMWTGCHVTIPTGGNPECVAAVAPDGMDWQSALSFCASLTFGGWDDWRLPNIMELYSIVDSGRYNPAVDETAFSMIPSTRFWTSSTRISVPGYAWYVNLLSGWTGSVLKTDTESTEGSTTVYQHYPLCVRDAD